MEAFQQSRVKSLDASHIQNYWKQHMPLVNTGVDAFWPDEGDWFNLHERIKRHQLYYQGHLSAHPNIRPWSLQRNGYPGYCAMGRMGMVRAIQNLHGKHWKRK